ncbi:hypothetical protein NUU61_006027 [Penicillium alfredii]|uniref:Uncharacterized protein n=1 Tax=Penicillium alfredii TaxID=1506179 RepID=A0A9W9K3V4_9EURO|nr:uncharacterized protein NUU61_006027 [Penicillium alfredii]KAJ5091157.1 hypothetical protein NUU61_006027 [Penicillium alfredii]
MPQCQTLSSSSTAIPTVTGTFADKKKITLDFSTSLLARAMIGKIPNRVSIKEICTLLESLPLPDKGAPNQNCNGLAESFDLDPFMDDSLAFADRRLRDLESTLDTINYRLR